VVGANLSKVRTAVETTAKDFDRLEPRKAASAAREKVQQAGAAASEEVQNLIADVEDLIDRVGDAADPEVKRLRSKVASAVVDAKKSIVSAADQVQHRPKRRSMRADRYVHGQPWEAIGIAALAGVAVGFLISTRRQ
jgi:ElaB/YqjD/DUF883 family membrane-anchored ribosome-binding protein